METPHFGKPHFDKLSTSFEEGENFESQFNKKEVVKDFYGQDLEFVVVDPKTEKEDEAVLLAPGWAENQDILKDTMRSLYDSDLKSLSLTHLHHGENSELIEDAPTDTSVLELRKAEALLAIMEKENISKVDAVVHSEGGINGLIAAYLKPEKFRSITLIGSAGLIGKDNFFKLAGRFTLGMGQGIVEAISDPEKREKLLEIEKEILKYIAKNPVRAVKEANAIAKSDIVEILKYLKSKGVGINIINAVDDLVFPMDNVQDIIDADMVDGFYSTKGNHYELVTNPQKYIGLVVHGIEALRQKKLK